ncbi:ATP-grasp domain-containing protein [Brevibacillus brevis]|uniref:ATP-grasp domain-containing protein n=1 Tax=Brevibacillus brevis TaxID=1393 RepID=A0A2Z4MPZ1_BREBE|nr:ATP-grasp domain-containing protein [Brevibacillus brevis]AWX58578.1 ATP-grasp domain-containing protein [Brevibacillus brevis]
MKKILITAGGTATAWHLSTLIKSRFKENFKLYICDTNPRHLVPSAQLADYFKQVPSVMSTGYREYMIDFLNDNNIDIIVPLIDHDIHIFNTDDQDLLKIKVLSTGITKGTSTLLKNKAVWTAFLKEQGISVPKTYTKNIVEQNSLYIVKPVLGFGSRDVRKVAKDEVDFYKNDERYLVQEICNGPEITVEVFQNDGIIRSLCRERVEIKSGVCTKAKIWFDRELHELTKKICGVISLPKAFCYQVMKNENNQWVVIDINPRLGAGTSMSTTYGWSLASAFLSIHGNLPYDPLGFLKYQDSPKYVLRVYEDLLI